MDLTPIPFAVSTPVRSLIAEIEQLAANEVLIRDGEFNRFDEPAAVMGGLERWVPHVTVNVQRREAFDEHGLAHELLHIRRFLLGAVSLETPDAVAGTQGVDSENRKAFANDVTNQIEHIAIFPQLVELGFEPHAHADEWKERQIAELSESTNRQFGPVDHSWAAVKLAVSEFLGRSLEVRARYAAAFDRFSPQARVKGAEIAKSIRWHGLLRSHNLLDVYREMLATAGVPKHALLMKQFDFKRKIETLKPIP